MNCDDKGQIRHVKNSDSLSADLVSLPTKELEKRVRLLENAINSMARKGSMSNVVITDRQISSAVQI